MGKVIVKVKFSNIIDVYLADNGNLPSEQVRSIETEGIIDTGAVLVSLPEPLAQELGLKFVEERTVRYANGSTAKKQIGGGLLVEIQGRTSETRCIIEPGSQTVLIGQIPLEEMDWMVHPQGQKLVPGHEGFEERNGVKS